MKTTLTSADTVDIPNIKHAASGETVIVTTQGDADDFTWNIEFSLNEGTAWKKYKDPAGETEFSGSDSKVVIVPSEASPLGAEEIKRVNIVDMGTATEVIVGLSA